MRLVHSQKSVVVALLELESLEQLQNPFELELLELELLVHWQMLVALEHPELGHRLGILQLQVLPQFLLQSLNDH